MTTGDRIRVTTAPWTGELGVVEHVDGAYHIVRLDKSVHKGDVQALYPNEIERSDEPRPEGYSFPPAMTTPRVPSAEECICEPMGSDLPGAPPETQEDRDCPLHGQVAGLRAEVKRLREELQWRAKPPTVGKRRGC